MVSNPSPRPIKDPKVAVLAEHFPDSGSSTPISARNPSPYLIRPATEADVAGIVHVGRKVWVETFSHTATPADISAYLDSSYTPDLISRGITNPNLRYLVACPNEKPHEVAAFASLATSTSSSEPSVSSWPKPIELQRIYVDSPHHGAGLARRIAEELYELGRREGYESIWLGVLPENFRAVKFYEKCGFKKVGSHEFRVGDQLDIDDIMARLL